MLNISTISEAARLIGDPARANMLFALKDDGTLSAGDLAAVAGVAASTASEHLGHLISAGLVQVKKTGRHRHYSLRSAQVAEALEGLEAVAGLITRGRTSPAPSSAGRCCYDHIAGPLGVHLAQAFAARGYLAHTETGTELTKAGADWVSGLGIDHERLAQQPRRFIRMCPDWSEGGLHLGGALGAALFAALQRRDWVRRRGKSTDLMIPPFGREQFRQQFGIKPGDLA